MGKVNGGVATTSGKLTAVSDENVTNYSAKGQISNENIFTTRDKAALVFHEYVRNRAWTNDWLAYFTLFLGLAVPILTCEFKGLMKGNDVIISGGVCKGFALALCCMSLCACFWCAWRRIANRKQLTCEYFLEQLRKASVNVD